MHKWKRSWWRQGGVRIQGKAIEASALSRDFPNKSQAGSRKLAVLSKSPKRCGSVVGRALSLLTTARGQNDGVG